VPADKFLAADVEHGRDLVEVLPRVHDVDRHGVVLRRRVLGRPDGTDALRERARPDERRVVPHHDRRRGRNQFLDTGEPRVAERGEVRKHRIQPLVLDEQRPIAHGQDAGDAGCGGHT
jgi:hypothetical protein